MTTTQVAVVVIEVIDAIGRVARVSSSPAIRHRRPGVSVLTSGPDLERPVAHSHDGTRGGDSFDD
jgi:hypothetical protein